MSDKQPLQINENVSAIAKLHYTLRRIEFLNRDLDGYWEINGPHFRSIDQPLQNALEDFKKMIRKIKKRYEVALKTFAKRVGMPYEEWMNRSVEIPGRPGFIPRRHAWAIYCSLFNEANLQAIRASEDNNYTDEQLEYIVGIMTDAEKQIFHEHVEHFASLKDKVWQRIHTLNGIYPREIDGLYWPIKVEPRTSVEAGATSSRSAAKNLFESTLDSAYVPSLFTLKGTRKATDVDDSWILPRLIDQARYVAFALTLRDTQRIVAHPKWAEMVKTTRGEAWYDQYMGYLLEIANPNVESSNEPTEVRQALGVLDEAENQLVGEGLFDRDAFDLLRRKIEGELHLNPLALGKLFAEVGGTPREWIYAQMGNIAGDYLESGQFHVYRGVLDTLGPGDLLSSGFTTFLTTNWLG